MYHTKFTSWNFSVFSPHKCVWHLRKTDALVTRKEKDANNQSQKHKNPINSQIQNCTYSLTNTKIHIFSHKYKNAPTHLQIQKYKQKKKYKNAHTQQCVRGCASLYEHFCISFFVCTCLHLWEFRVKKKYKNAHTEQCVRGCASLCEHFCISFFVCTCLHLWETFSFMRTCFVWASSTEIQRNTQKYKDAHIFVFVSDKNAHTKARPPYKANPLQIQKCPYKICNCQTHVCGENSHQSQGMHSVTKCVFRHTKHEIFAHLVCVSALTFENVLQIEILKCQLTHHECMGWLRLVGFLKS